MKDIFNLTFVTHYLYNKETSPKNDEWNIERLNELVSIGIPLYIFVSQENAEDFVYLNESPNIHIEVIDKSELWVFKQLKNYEYTLPAYRNEVKDTEDYLAVSNSKIELVNRAIEHNTWNTEHFAYIDFNITYLFSEKKRTYDYLRYLSKRDFFSKIMIFPGCSSTINIDNILQLNDEIYWRFCGGFFIGDSESLKNWGELYKSAFIEYLSRNKKLTWDVNFWAWMETIERWCPTWYSANHNDSIITDISVDFITKNLSSVSRMVIHNYPVIPQFRPTSASYLKTSDGRRWLNIRYVNYWLYSNGCYGYPTSKHIIENKNMLCELDDNMVPIQESFKEVTSCIDIPEYTGDVISVGMEDIRLYTGKDGNIRFIATNVNLSPTGTNNMIVGDYDIKNACISNGKIIFPPGNTMCEKNWIPIEPCSSSISSDLLGDYMEERFIYKWFPLEIGKRKINNTNGNEYLEIIKSYSINAPHFQKVRGSTIFHEDKDGILGVVHFSEEHSPRHYYHILVLLEKHTLRPLKYSNCFCFKSLGVEFCIGFTNELNDDYVFWISQMDRDPLTVFVPKSEIELCFDF